MHSSRVSRIRLRRRVAALCLLALPATLTEAQSLLGSRESLLRQNEQAQAHGFSYLRTSTDVRDYAKRGVLVRLRGNADYDVESDEVSFPYARPEVKLFIERLSDQYRSACGEKLVVTSLTRPITRQPHNASVISVHPTGMAADLRRSNVTACRSWLEATLLDLEGKGVLEATKEQYPPHYHVALFPNPYLRSIGSGELPRVEVADVDVSDDPAPARAAHVRHAVSRRSRHHRSHTALAKRSGHGKHVRHATTGKKYRVGHGDSLWKIAHRSGVSVARIKQANRVGSRHLKPGQVLSIPSR
ncbi:MAG: LysM peptidoglycan-binding domain-containing protein [Acidobacteria bacterium]|nr:LysM peptidoglycan-binding domain-containing protein [Acidobacteriota bacterium]